MKRVRQFISAIIAAYSFVLTLYVIAKFIIFTSKPRKASAVENNDIEAALSNLFQNIAWLITFILTHSVLKSDIVKKFWAKIHLESAERSIYNLLSSFVLLQMAENWKIVEKWTLWNIACPNYSVTWWIFVLFHSLLWAIIIGGSLLMDLPEILGIKQVYYEILDLSPPHSYKSPSLNRLLSNIRHPSYTGFSLIFWSANLMTLDRLLLSILLTLYMFIAWNPDRKDYYYQQHQFELKKLELRYQLKQK